MRFLFHTTFKKDKHSILAVILLGSLSHFLYELSGGAAIFALFCPINESVWEHLKLLFFPFLFITAIQWYRQKPSLLPFFYHRFLGILCGLLTTVVLFYTYTGVIGRHFFNYRSSDLCIQRHCFLLHQQVLFSQVHRCPFAVYCIFSLDYHRFILFRFQLLPAEYSIIFPASGISCFPNRKGWTYDPSFLSIPSFA